MRAMEISPHRFCVAPMLDVTDRHCRYFLRQLSRRARLYTEMVTTGALLHGDAARHLRFDASERPLALQLGGCEPDELARCARFAADAGYDEVNLNVGCPSDRVQSARFGACLMRQPQRVADCVAAMRAAASLPVTVKCRIGVDDQEDYEDLLRFVDAVASAGCKTFLVHARKAWLQGLSPRENRESPPLRYDLVYRLKRERPALEIVLNGGIKTLAEAHVHLSHVDGVMLGRAAYDNPYLLAFVDAEIFGETRTAPARLQIIAAMRAYLAHELASGTPLRHMTRHLLGLYQGLPRARAWRRTLTEGAISAAAGLEVVQAALAWVEPEQALGIAA